MTDKHQFSSTFLNFAASVECCPLAGRPPPRPFFTASGIHWLQCWFCVVWLVNLTFPATSKNAINVALDTFMVPRCCRGLPTSSVISDAYQFKTCYIVVVYLCRHNTDSRNYSDHCWLSVSNVSRESINVRLYYDEYKNLAIANRSPVSCAHNTLIYL